MQAYDEATGQMYNETTVRVHSMVPAWTNTCTGKPQDPKTFVNKSVGTSSLRETATRTCAWYINDFSLELFTDTNIDWLPIKPIYDQLRETDTLTLKAWSLFRAAYPDEADVARDFNIRLYAEHSTQFSDLTSLGLRISHLSFSCLTFLSIHNVHLQTSHLMSLFSIPNLAVLDLNHNGPERPPGSNIGDPIDDRLIRNWSRAVSEQQAFTKLRVLILKGFPIEVEDTLKWLTSWPDLYMVRLVECYLAPDVHRSGEEQLFCNGNWKSLPLNPHIWKRLAPHDATVSRRLKFLYDTSSESLNLPTLGTSKDSHIFIHYSAHPYSITSPPPRNNCISLWFTRVPLSLDDAKEVPVPTPTPKRSNSGLKEEDGKKRKVREGKQKDVGALLGTFF